MSLAPVSNKTVPWIESSFLAIWTFVYYLTVSPITFAILSETSSTRLRAKTVGLSRNASNVAQIVSNIMVPRMINPTAWNWRGKTGFFFAGTTFLVVVWTFFRMPETKGRTFEELDILFARKINPRYFYKTRVDAYEVEPLGPEDLQEEPRQHKESK